MLKDKLYKVVFNAVKFNNRGNIMNMNLSYIQRFITAVIFMIPIVILSYFVIKIAVRDAIYSTIKRLKDENILNNKDLDELD